MKTFEAKYRGICAVCDETIYPGDEVGYEDDEVIHKDCAGSVPVNLDAPRPSYGIRSAGDLTRRPRTTPSSVCPMCSLEHVGECL